jgi:hypothetical protein
MRAFVMWIVLVAAVGCGYAALAATSMNVP